VTPPVHPTRTRPHSPRSGAGSGSGSRSVARPSACMSEDPEDGSGGVPGFGPDGGAGASVRRGPRPAGARAPVERRCERSEQCPARSITAPRCRERVRRPVSAPFADPHGSRRPGHRAPIGALGADRDGIRGPRRSVTSSTVDLGMRRVMGGCAPQAASPTFGRRARAMVAGGFAPVVPAPYAFLNLDVEESRRTLAA